MTERIWRIRPIARPGRLDGLDVLRGIAVGLVLFRHAWPDTFGGAGLVGVVIFFVLSGYLITAVLVRDIDRFGKVRYKRFYAHRAFRLLPALIGFLLVYVCVESATDVLGDRSTGIIFNTVITALVYIKDFPLPFDVSVAIAPLWTLAVEEQFYLLWPAVLLLAIRKGRIGSVLIWSAGLVLVAMVGSVLLASYLAPEKLNHVYSLPTTYGVALIAGSAVRVYQKPVFAMFATARVRLFWCMIAGLFLAAACLFAEVQFSVPFYVFGGPGVTLASCILVVLAASRDIPMPSWTTPLSALGVISYATYLWNYMIVEWLRGDSDNELSFWASLASVIFTVSTAIISWHTVERLGRKWRKNFDDRYVDSIGNLPQPAVPST